MIDLIGLCKNKKTDLSNLREVLICILHVKFLSVKGKTGASTLLKLEELLIKIQNMKHGVGRARRIRLVRGEINKVKKNLATDSSQSDGDIDASDAKSSSQNSSKAHTVNYLTIQTVIRCKLTRESFRFFHFYF